MRAWAWQLVRDGEGWDYQETHNCAGWCGLGTDEESTEQRREFRCALPGFDASTWRERGGMRVYMGRLPIVGQDVEFDPRFPPEDHDAGCPGAWYRCDFAQSLERYERLMTDGGFASNLLADRTDDRLVIEAMQCIERERLRARAHWADKRSEKR